MEQKGHIQFILPIGNIGERQKRTVTQQAMELSQHLETGGGTEAVNSGQRRPEKTTNPPH